MTCPARFVITLLLLLWATPSFAHPPYEIPAGEFTRGDGVKIQAVERYVDGILGRDPVSVEFRLADGRVIAQTGFAREEVVVRSTHAGIKVYHFQSNWLPIANSVKWFDGHKLHEDSSRRSVLLSPLVHTRAHWKEYGAVLLISGLLAASWRAARGIPNCRRTKVWRTLAAVIIAISWGSFILLTLIAVPVSPLILSTLGAAAWLALRKRVSRGRVSGNGECNGMPSR